MTRAARSSISVVNAKNKRRVLQLLCDNQGWRCALCGEPMSFYRSPTRKLGHVEPEEATIDHRLPKSKGGTNILSNLQAAHSLCNNRRGNQLLPGEMQ